MLTYSIFTTLHKSGYEEYGYRNISTFLDFWPKDIKYFVYTEGFKLKENPRIKPIDIKIISCLSNFKQKYSNVPSLNGLREEKYNFLYDFVKFSHKSYVMIDAMNRLTTDWIIWFDGDSITHSKITNRFFQKITDEKSLVTYLGRTDMYSETGFIAFNRRHPKILTFMQNIQKIYDDCLLDDAFFDSGYTDCHVFDFVRLQFEKDSVKFNNLTPNSDDKHPFINGPLGEYMDHLKGPRKERGKSRKIDLKNNSHKRLDYWQSIDK